ncbi:hypothetical protein ACHAWC_007795 [Mediolabrus comicus]
MGRKQRGGNSGGGGNSSGRGSNNKSKQNHSINSKETANDDALLSDDYEDENLDFCQRFFGDPLFSNRNVAILFLFATVLPMLAWIPHFVKEYRRVKLIQYLEEERQLRMQKARMEVEQQRKIEHMVQQQQQQSGQGLVLNDIAIDGEIRIIQQGSKSTVIHTPSDNYYEAQQQLLGNIDGSSTTDNIFSRQTAQEKFPPTLCPDGKTIGYDNWFTLRDAISEVNAIAAEEFLRYNEYLMINSQTTGGGGGGGEKNSNLPVYNPPEPFVVCPGVTLNQKSIWGSILSPSYWVSSIYSLLSFGSSSSSSTPTRAKSKNKLSSIFINAEDITIECVMCTVDLPGTHFSFGPHAKNVKIKGFTFRGATSSSLTFHHHGADVHLEDCYWLWNTGGVVSNSRAPHAKVNVNDGMNGSPPPGGTTTAGAVADLNSTSTVAFYRCVIDDQKQSPRKATVGAGVANVPGMNPPAGHNIGGSSSQGVASSSFTIRN